MVYDHGCSLATLVYSFVSSLLVALILISMYSYTKRNVQGHRKKTGNLLIYTYHLFFLAFGCYKVVYFVTSGGASPNPVDDAVAVFSQIFLCPRSHAPLRSGHPHQSPVLTLKKSNVINVIGRHYRTMP